MRKLSLAAMVMLVGCLRRASSMPVREEEDKSIRFPEFYGRIPIVVGEQGKPYELDGVTLRAIAIAANDFIPPQSEARQCWDTQVAHVYRVIRQQDIIFVSIGPDPAYCEPKLLMFDSGVKYAISVNGRILRRLFDGEPEGPVDAEPPDAGVPDFSQPVPYSKIGVTDAPSVFPFLRRASPDGGVSLDGGLGDGGSSAGPSK